MSNVIIIDYGLCNLDSIARAIDECGGHAEVTNDARDLGHADRIVLPGVGSFSQAMANLTEAGFDKALPEAAAADVPVLGICLGMQLLGETSEEGGNTRGIGLLGGETRKIAPRPEDGRVRVPHIGWNDIAPSGDHPLFDGIEAGTDFYFVHGYRMASPADEVIATVDYCGETVAATSRGHVMAVQFHPEKSQAAGFRLLKNFLTY